MFLSQCNMMLHLADLFLYKSIFYIPIVLIQLNGIFKAVVFCSDYIEDIILTR